MINIINQITKDPKLFEVVRKDIFLVRIKMNKKKYNNTFKNLIFEQNDIFVSGEDGYHTYRIPAMVVSKEGTVLAFCEGRRDSREDYGDIDIVLKRSFDDGETWKPIQLVVEDGPNTIGNPSPVVDQKTGIIWLVFCKNNIQVYVMKSEDDGKTWSKPEEITKYVKEDGWYWYATGPCHGIQLHNDKLVIPCDHKRGPRLPHKTHYSHVIYSEDNGSSWEIGGIIGPYMNECTIVQTCEGSLYLNMRNYTHQDPSPHMRVFAWSEDDGITWSDVGFDKSLIEPICQASIIRFTDVFNHDKNRILFSNPASSNKRERMTVRLSYDECKTWSVSKLLYPGPSAYSDLAITSNMNICCLYERGDKSPYEKITFTNFNIEWLTGGLDGLKL